MASSHDVRASTLPSRLAHGITLTGRVVGQQWCDGACCGQRKCRISGRKVAEVSKRWFRVRDTYGIQVAPDLDTTLALAVAVALDAMTDRG